MKTGNQKHGLARVCLFGVWVMVCLLAASSPVWAQRSPDPLSEGVKERRLFTIVDKSPDYNYIFITDRRFKVLPTAVILDYRGRKISLRDLLVPCAAYITYQMFGDGRDPLVQKIQLK